MFNKKIILLLSTFSLCLSHPIFGEESGMMEMKKKRRSMSAKAKFTSDYVFRGIPQRGNSIQGAIKFKPFKSGPFASLWAANNPKINSPEGRLSLGYKFKHHETRLAFWLKYTRYNFIREPRNDMNEYNIGMSWKKNLFLNVDYTNEWRALTSSNLHIGLNGKFKIGRKIKILARVGQNIVNNEDIFGYKDYLYYGIGLGLMQKKTMYAIHWSDTDRDLKSSGTTTSANDSSLRFSLTRYF